MSNAEVDTKKPEQNASVFDEGRRLSLDFFKKRDLGTRPFRRSLAEIYAAQDNARQGRPSLG